jgi:hypothetical protein
MAFSSKSDPRWKAWPPGCSHAGRPPLAIRGITVLLSATRCNEGAGIAVSPNGAAAGHGAARPSDRTTQQAPLFI